MGRQARRKGTVDLRKWKREGKDNRKAGKEERNVGQSQRFPTWGTWTHSGTFALSGVH